MSRPHRYWGIAVLLCLLAAALPATAAANEIYWTDQGGVFHSDTAPGSAVKLLFGEGGELGGIALDPGHGKVYWVNNSTKTIEVGNIDGSGTPTAVYTGLSEPAALALDPAGGRLFWTTGAALVGDLGADALWAGTVTGATPRRLAEESPERIGGIAYDSTTDRVYWSSKEPFENPILKGQPVYAVAPDGGDRENVARVSEWSLGLAIDGSTRNIYNAGSGEVWASAFGATGNSRALDFDPGNVQGVGVALDPVLSRLYWGSIFDHSVRSVATAGSSEIMIHELLNPAYIATLEEPKALAPPALSGGDEVGEALHCGPGTWEADVPGVFAGLAPQQLLYSWYRDGTRILGATAPTLTPSETGTYSCRVAAVNPAGQTIGESEARSVAARTPNCSDTIAATPEGTPRQIVLACDTEAGANYELLGSPAHGTLTGFDPADGDVTYTPDPGFSGEDLFSYRAHDSGGTSNAATASILVRPPVPTCAPVAARGTAERPLAITLSCEGGGTLRYSVLADPAHGRLIGLDSATGKVTYVPDSGYTGTDSFAFGAANEGGRSAEALSSVEIVPAPPAAAKRSEGTKPKAPGAPSSRFTLGRTKTAAGGSAILAVKLPGPGRVRLNGAAVRGTSKAVAGAGTVSLVVRPRPSARRRLEAAGRLPVTAKVTFIPTGGSAATRTVRLVLHVPERGAR